MAEIFNYLAFFIADYFKNRFKNFGLMASNAPSAYFPTVQNKVILGSQNF